MSATVPGREAPEVDREEDERRLAEGLGAGSPESVRSFLERAHHPVFCMACRLARDADLGRDWTHTALIAILEDLERGRFLYRHPGSFWAWFRKRAYYLLLDQFRRRRLLDRRELSGHEDPTPAFMTACGIGDPVAELERVELLAALEACLAGIESDEQQRALRLLLLQDQSYEGIARAMRAPHNTVRAWIRRGRLRLRICLAGRLGLGSRGASDV